MYLKVDIVYQGLRRKVVEDIGNQIDMFIYYRCSDIIFLVFIVNVYVGFLVDLGENILQLVNR